MRINWRWIKGRLRAAGCWHQWIPGLTNWPEQEQPPPRVQACGKCGIWRWFPVLR